MEKNVAPTLTRKPSIKRNPPVVRETKTSKIRLLKSNPLLMHELGIKELKNIKDQEKINLLDLKKTKFEEIRTELNSSRLNGERPSICNSQTFKKPFNISKPSTSYSRPKILPKTETSVKDLSGVEIFNKSEQFLSSTKVMLNHNNSKSKKIDFVKRNIEATKLAQENRNRRAPRPSLNRVPSFKNGKRPTNISNNADEKADNKKQPDKKEDVKTKNKPLRRSLSAQHFDRKRGKSKVAPESCYFRLEKTNSCDDVKQFDHILHIPLISPVIEEKNISFKTPSAYKRRSTIFRTPNTLNKSQVFASTPAPSDLQKRLSDWLKKRGKQFTYHHLKCFGIHAAPKINELDEENKENIVVEISDDDDSYKSLGIESPKTDHNTENNLNNIAKDALQDLHNLLLEGYPRDQCEAWLRLIHQKYNKLQEEPQYWEIRAALEQARGNITSAVECYQRAIVEGAEIQQVDESLEQLLQKFSLLNISPKKENAEDRARIVKDARNVFKSSIIQFAVRERTLKKNTGEVRKSLVATPVRRSTRLSRSHYTLTPGVKIYSTLKDVEDPIKNNLEFIYNNALQ